MFKNYLSKIPVYILVWTIALGIFTFFREFGQDIVKEYSPLNLYELIAVHLIIGTLAGIIFGSLQMIFEKFVFKRVNFGVALFLGSIGYLISIVALLSVAILIFSHLLNEELHVILYRELLLSKEMLPLSIYCFIVTALINFISEIDKKFGPGNLMKMLNGKFYTPKEENRIFMFMDLRSSTTIAEKLGHIKYSELIQDCFKDISVLEKYKAEIYQYVGDEAVITWEKETGLKKNRCVEAFWSFQKKIDSRKDHYLKKYGVLPEFKAGMHLGIITVAEVGEIKREIAYHGDTINTASRIQDECNVLGKDFLISEEMLAHISDSGKYDLQFEGNIQLKGKTEAAKIYSVNRF